MNLPLPLTLLLITLSTHAIAHAIAQDIEQVTLRFISFPKNANPQPVHLHIGEGMALEVKAPTNALSEPYQVNRLPTWTVGKLEEATNEEGVRLFTSYGSAKSIAAADQIILLIRNGPTNADGLRVVPMANTKENFGGGNFFFMNASKVDIAGMLGGTQFALKPGTHTIIMPKEKIQREGGAGGIFTEFFFRKEDEARPFFSSTWPHNEKARSMVFFYHDTHNDRLRMHTIRDYLP